MNTLFDNKPKTIFTKYYYALFDSNNLFWIAFLSSDLKKLIKHNNTTLFKGAIEIFFSLIELYLDKYVYDDGQVYFLFDNENSKLNTRKQIDPSYKHTRDASKVPEGFYETLDFCKALLNCKSNRYRICYLTGYEADDLTMPILKNVELNKMKQAVVFSNDLDWSRNIKDCVDWCDWHNIITYENFYKKYSFHPTEERVKLYKVLEGDRSDNIPKGISLTKLELEIVMNESISLNNLYENINNVSISDALKQRFLILKEKLYNNYRLVDFISQDLKPSDFITLAIADSEKFQKMWNIVLKGERRLF